MKIREIVVVEGKDDIAAVKAAVDATVIATHGYGFGKKLLATLKEADRRRGIIVLTDPDTAGEAIRRRIADAIPGARHAFVPRTFAVKTGDIGVENAPPEAIREALVRARATVETSAPLYTVADMRRWGLVDAPDAAGRRERIAVALAIGHGNAKQCLKRLNGFAIPRETIERALAALEDHPDPNVGKDMP